MLLLLAACGNKQSDCIAEANELSRFLTTMDHDAPINAGDTKLLLRTDALVRPAPYARSVVVGAKSIEFEGRTVSPDELADVLLVRKRDADARGERLRYEPDPQQIDLVIDSSPSSARPPAPPTTRPITSSTRSARRSSSATARSTSRRCAR